MQVKKWGADILSAMMNAGLQMRHGGYPLQSMSSKTRKKYLHNVKNTRRYDTNKYVPHQGKAECERRRYQAAEGRLTHANGLVL